MKTTILTFLLAITVFYGCKKSTSVTIIQDGTYSGTFTIKNDINTYTESIPVSLTLNQGEFTISLTTNAKPTGGNGTFTVKNGIATFLDENTWTGEFDRNRILNGEYDMEIKGRELIFTRRAQPQTNIHPATSYSQMSYQYVLKKDD
jgi:hypothetical protein